MKKLLASAGIVSVLSLGGTLALAPAAFANNGAVVASDFGCALLDSDGVITGTQDSHSVLTPSGNGQFRCHREVAAPATGKAVKFNNANTGLSCVTSAGVTTDWSEVISASGQATLTCNIH